MPLDQQGFVFASPRVEAPVTDDVLRVLIEGRGFVAAAWNKGKLFGAEGSVCALGGLVRTGAEPTDGIYKAARNALADAIGGRSPMGFNDAPETTKAHVLAMYDRAIAARRAENAQAAVSTGEATP